jgi:iron complex outermembrane receptor protein
MLTNCIFCYGQVDSIYNQSIDSLILDEVELKAQRIFKTDIDFSFDVDMDKLASVPQIDQFLNKAPGVEMQIGALNTNRINIRGIGSRSPFATSKLKAYLDDIPLTDGAGETSLEDINLSIIDKIQLIKGPNSSLYGGTLGGTILFKTKNSLQDQSISSISTTFGSYGLKRINADIKLNRGYGSKSTFVNAEYLESNGYRQNNEYNKFSSSLIHKNIGKDSYWTVLVNLINLRSEIPSSLNLDDYLNSPRNAAFNWASAEGYENNLKLRLGLNYNKKLTTNSSLVATLFSSIYDAYEFRPFNVLDDDSKSLGFRGRYILDGENFSFTIGTEISTEDYNWKIFESLESKQGALLQDNNSNRSQFQIFNQFQYKLHKNMLIFGGLNTNSASFDINYNNQNDNTKKTYSWLVLPRLGLNYTSDNETEVQVQISRGMVYPGLDESLDPNGLFIQSLKPELGINYELNTQWKLHERMKFKTTFFVMYVQDILVNRQDQNGQSFALNAGKTRHMGIEPSISLSILQNEKTTLNLGFNGSFGSYKFTDFIGQSSFNGNDLTGVAANKYNISFDFENPIMSIKSSLRYVDNIPVDDKNSIYSEAYYVQRISIETPIDLFSHNVNISFSIDNLWNAKYASMISVNPSSFGGNAPRIYYPGLPRNYMLGLKYIL